MPQKYDLNPNPKPTIDLKDLLIHVKIYIMLMVHGI